MSRFGPLGMGGLGWSFSHLVVPVSFGAMVDAWGYSAPFYALGLSMMVLAGLTPSKYRWRMTVRISVEETRAATHTSAR